METHAQDIERRQLEKWMIDPEYEIVPERGLVRLTQYKKSFSPDVVVKKDGVPLLLKSTGKPLLACEVYPERADLALDMDGNLLGQGEFTQKYMNFLGAFVYPEGTELAAEPVPNVERFITEIQDPFTESSGPVEIGFDPKLNEEVEMVPLYDTNGRKAGDRDFMKGEANSPAQSSVSDTLIQAMLDKLSPDQVQEALRDATASPIPIIGGEATESETLTPQTVSSEPETGGLVNAPCGKSVKRQGLGAHKRHCNEPACGGEGVNTQRSTGGGEAA